MITRKAAVAGMFYPNDPDVLATDINTLVENANPIENLTPKAMILPHAGIIYSGPVAASGYKILKKMQGSIKKVVLLGPSHYVYFQGMALPKAEVFQTPLADIPLDTELMQQLVTKFDQVLISEDAHLQEHSLEVHCPFLQCCLSDFKLIPFTVGEANPKDVAEVINYLWGGKETIIIISSDLSHYNNYATAMQLDAKTASNIENLATNLTGDQACGCNPINGMLSTAGQKQLKVTRLLLQNSGDTAGDKSRVVGYGSFAICPLPKTD